MATPSTRILVQCKTDSMPGSYIEKIPLMANLACQKVWDRGLRESSPYYDRLTTYGGWMNKRCLLLIDNGPVDQPYSLVRFRWDGNKLVEDIGRLHPYIQNQFDTIYQFNPSDRPKENGRSDEQLKEDLEPEKYDKMMKAREEMTARFNVKLSKEGAAESELQS